MERSLTEDLLETIALKGVIKMAFKSEDEKRKEAALKANKACTACSGTGTFGIGGRGAPTASACSKCNGSGQV